MTVWLVRAGKHGEREAMALEKDLAVIGWDQLPDLGKVKARDELEALLAKTYPDAKTNRLANHGGQIWSFISRIKEGDFIVLPLKNRAGIAIGKVKGPYSYRSDLPEGWRHTRPVQWIKKDIPRSAFDQDILYSFGAFMTVCQIQRNQAEERIRSVLEGKAATVKPLKVPDSASPEASEANAVPDLEDMAKNQLELLINQKFKGHELTRLAEAILEAQGYETIRSPPGADESVDILAGRGHLGFDEPRLGVEVKSQESPVGTDVLDKLRGGLKTFDATQGLLVSWGGFKQSIDRRKGYFEVRLWDRNDLLNALFENYEKLDKDLQAEIPLKRIWTLIQEE